MTAEERTALINDIVLALSAKYPGTKLTEEEINYVRLGIQREAQSIKLRQAIIEKSLTGLAWLIILFVGSVLLEWAKNHGYK